MTTSFVPGRRFRCFVDFCNDAVQFCYLKQRRCRYCSDFTQDCLTNQQQQNCTRYCMEKWVKLHGEENGDTDCNELTTTAIVALTILVIVIAIIICINVANRCCKNKLRLWLEVVKCSLCTGAPSNTPTPPCAVYSAANTGRTIEQAREEGEGMDDPLINRGDRECPSMTETSEVPNSGSGRTVDTRTEHLPNSGTIHVSVYNDNSSNSEVRPNSIQENNAHIARPRIDNGINPVGGQRSDADRLLGNQTSSMSANVGNNVARPELSSVSSSNIQRPLPYVSNSGTDTGYDTGGSNFELTHLKQPHFMCNNRQLGPIIEGNASGNLETLINDVEHEIGTDRRSIRNTVSEPETLSISDFSK